MATKKTDVEEIIDTEKVTEKAKKVVQREDGDAWKWKTKRSIALPRARDGEEKFAAVSVNNRDFQVPRDGKSYEVPLPVYEVLMQSVDAQNAAEDAKYEKQLSNQQVQM